MKQLALGVALVSVVLVACGDDGGSSGDGDGAGGSDAGGSCELKAQGESCTDHVECCSAFCDGGECAAQPGDCDDVGTSCASGATCCSGRCGEDGTCSPGVAGCQPLGGSCDNAADCCSLGCSAGECSEELCRTIGQECVGDSDCCSNNCDPESNTCQFDGTCRPAGEDCSSGGDNACCSKNCVDFGDGDMRCSAGGICRVEGEVCSQDNDCCNFSCDDGYCRIISECAMVGEPCIGDTECCSYACREDASGFQSCRYLGGCRPFGELCRQDSDCCNDPANGGPGVCAIFNEETGVGRCQNPGGCAPAGEVCGINGEGPSGSNECCPGAGPVGEANCVETDIGVMRCLATGNCIADGMGTCTEDADCCSSNCDEGTGMCGGFECFPDGADCAFSDQCCSGICAPDNDGNLVCSGACIPDDGTCTTDTDCCGGYCDTQTLTCSTIVVE